jgi:hypothetical protein
MHNFTKLIYSLNNAPERRKSIFERLIKIYHTTKEEEINTILDKIKIKFREQQERGASNHKKLTVYIPFKDIEKFNLKNKEDVFKYLENPKSPILHETMHIFQNLAKIFPDVKYMEKQYDGKETIDYEKYINDNGEKQARLEQVVELLSWGFTRNEIVDFLYNRAHNDKKLWNHIIDQAQKVRKNQ